MSTEGLPTPAFHVCDVPMRIDFAVINNKLNTQVVIQQESEQYVTELDIVTIEENLFKRIFYDENAFYVNPLVLTDEDIRKYIEFAERKVNLNKFGLLDEIISNYCKDACVPQSAFTPCSLIGLQKQIVAIKNLRDVYLNQSGICCMNWNEIVETIRASYYDAPTLPDEVEVVLTFTVSFLPAATNTCKFLPTVVKFNYRVSVHTNLSYRCV